jgi:hypothetical protein
MASCSANSASKKPPLASKQDEYRRVSSVPRNSLSRRSNCLWISCVPQMNRTDESPYPQRSRPALAAATISG